MTRKRLLQAALVLLTMALLIPGASAKAQKRIGLMLEGTTKTFANWTDPSLSWFSSDGTVASASA